MNRLIRSVFYAIAFPALFAMLSIAVASTLPNDAGVAMMMTVAFIGVPVLFVGGLIYGAMK